MITIRVFVKKMYKLVQYTFEYLKYMVLYPIAVIKYKRHKIYLISERGDEARDNAYHLFVYYRTHHPELEVYYAIRKGSPDREKIEKYGNIVDYKSLKHYLLFIASSYKISTHIMGFSTNRLFYFFYKNRIPMRGKTIFLQHGITQNDLPSLYQESTDLSLFVCGAKPEFDYVSKHFHYVNGEVQYTGLARYDALSNAVTKRQILIMPTWRLFLKNKSKTEVSDSEYVKAWNELLCDSKLVNKLEEKEIELIFYPHYEMQKNIDLFKSVSKNVKIASFTHYDVQTLLKESALLITDFSSVFFDFAYMGKPTVYYQFDEQEFMNNHYSKGYFDYHKMGFGEVCTSCNQVISLISDYINNDFKITSNFAKRIDQFFVMRDTNNCKRIYNAIRKL